MRDADPHMTALRGGLFEGIFEGVGNRRFYGKGIPHKLRGVSKVCLIAEPLFGHGCAESFYEFGQ